MLFEIGTEELPAAEVSRTAEAVRQALADRLAATRLGHGEIRTSATPRRVVAVIENVQPRESDAERTVRGPRAGVAFDAGGAPTKAALGFARGQDVDVDALHRLDVEGVDYVGVVRTDVGRSAVDVLSVVLA